MREKYKILHKIWKCRIGFEKKLIGTYGKSYFWSTFKVFDLANREEDIHVFTKRKISPVFTFLVFRLIPMRIVFNKSSNFNIRLTSYSIYLLFILFILRSIEMMHINANWYIYSSRTYLILWHLINGMYNVVYIWRSHLFVAILFTTPTQVTWKYFEVFGILN